MPKPGRPRKGPAADFRSLEFRGHPLAHATQMLNAIHEADRKLASRSAGRQVWDAATAEAMAFCRHAVDALRGLHEELADGTYTPLSD